MTACYKQHRFCREFLANNIEDVILVIYMNCVNQHIDSLSSNSRSHRLNKNNTIEAVEDNAVYSKT